MEDLINLIAPVKVAEWLIAIFAVCSVFFEVSPIKINPITSALKWFGKKTNGDLMDKVNEIGKRVDENEIDRLRWEILDFANSCRNGRKHTQDEFDHIIEMYEKYHMIIDARGMKNGKLDLEYEYVVRIYKQCQDDNSFL